MSLTRQLLMRLNTISANRKYQIGKNSLIYHDGLIYNRNSKKSKNDLQVGECSIIMCEILLYSGGKISIGDNSFIGKNTHIWSNNRISIGNRVLISHNVNIFDNHTHPIHPDERHKHFDYCKVHGLPDMKLGAREIIIEDDVWICCNSVILPGVKIGRGSIIGAASVVTKNIPEMTIAVGNPAKPIRPIMEQDKEKYFETLLEIN